VRSRRKRETCRGIGERYSGNNGEDCCSFEIVRKFSLRTRFARLFPWNRALPPILFRARARARFRVKQFAENGTMRTISWIFPTDFRDDVLRSVPRIVHSVFCESVLSSSHVASHTRDSRRDSSASDWRSEARGGESIDYRCLLLWSLPRSAIESDKGSYINLSYVKMNC